MINLIELGVTITEDTREPKKVDLSICADFIEPKEITRLGKGELGCMVLAEEHGAEILISDRRARQVARNKRLESDFNPNIFAAV